MTKTENTIEDFYNFLWELDGEDLLTFLIRFLNLIENPYGRFWDILYEEYINQEVSLEEIIDESLGDDYICIKHIINSIDWSSSKMWQEPFLYFHNMFLELGIRVINWGSAVVSAMEKILNANTSTDDTFIPINI